MQNTETEEQWARIEKELVEILRCSIRKLRARWKELYRSEPPSSFGPDLLRRSIAYRIQEQIYGGLEPNIRREIEQLVRTIRKSPSGKIDLPQRIKSGSVLVREWKGQTYRVTVSGRGFIYNKTVYSTLSEIARQITGTRWNGPRFFGLRKSSETDSISRNRPVEPKVI